MVSDGLVTLYHGTDWKSVLNILNHGLDIEHLRQFQVGRMTQLGEGWYTTDSSARYTLRQTTMNGTWKELLLAILVNFSREVAPIHRHDESRAFTPTAAVAESA